MRRAADAEATARKEATVPLGSTLADAERAKQEVRERIWALLDQQQAALPPGAAGRIPNFVGADAAADRLAALSVWQDAKVIKSNPDKAQLPVRASALAAGKLLYMAVPRLAHERPFLLLDAASLSVPPREAASSRGAATAGRNVSVSELRPVDLVICGSVVVNREGTRLGKGAGYSDLEVALLLEAGLISPETVLVTTVHSLQVVDEPLPETTHDFRVDLIVTPEETIWCPPHQRPTGIMWEHLTEEKIAAIPVLAASVHRSPHGD
jgi:5-formyltetrahydrofolate cyclo-ligase